MAKENPTSVNLTELAQAVKDEYAPVYGLKNILSAGLVLFGGLSGDQKEVIIRKANQLKPAVSDAHAVIADEIAIAAAHKTPKHTRRKQKNLKSG